MSWELILLSISCIIVFLLTLATIYQIFALGDLEYDYINPYDLAARINALVTKEFFTQGVLCALFLVTWHWFMFLMSAPVTYYHFKLYKEGKHLIDVTEVFSALEKEKNYRVVKLGFYLVLLIAVMFRLVLVGSRLLVGERTGMHAFFGVL